MPGFRGRKGISLKGEPGVDGKTFTIYYIYTYLYLMFLKYFMLQ